MNKPDFSALTQRQCAAMHGVDERTLRRWDEDGHPRNSDGTYNAPLSIAWRLQRESGSELDLNAERARLAKEQADKTALENAVKRGELISTQRIEIELGRIAAAARSRFLSIPTKLAARLAGLKNVLSIRTVLTDAVNEALADFCKYRPINGVDNSDSVDDEDSGDIYPASDTDGQPVGRPKKVSKSRK